MVVVYGWSAMLWHWATFCVPNGAKLEWSLRANESIWMVPGTYIYD